MTTYDGYARWLRTMATHDGHRLKQHLKAGHVSMIVIGGALATGLLIGSGYATGYVDPALGFSAGYCYLFGFLIAIPNQITAVALIL